MAFGREPVYASVGECVDELQECLITNRHVVSAQALNLRQFGADYLGISMDATAWQLAAGERADNIVFNQTFHDTALDVVDLSDRLLWGEKEIPDPEEAADLHYDRSDVDHFVGRLDKTRSSLAVASVKLDTLTSDLDIPDQLVLSTAGLFGAVNNITAIQKHPRYLKPASDVLQAYGNMYQAIASSPELWKQVKSVSSKVAIWGFVKAYAVQVVSESTAFNGSVENGLTYTAHLDPEAVPFFLAEEEFTDDLIEQRRRLHNAGHGLLIATSSIMSIPKI